MDDIIIKAFPLIIMSTSGVFFVQIFHDPEIRFTKLKLAVITVLITLICLINYVLNGCSNEPLDLGFTCLLLIIPVIELWKRKLKEMSIRYVLKSYFILSLANVLITLLSFMITYALTFYVDFGNYDRLNIENVIMIVLIFVFNACMYFFFVRRNIEARFSISDKLLIFSYFILLFYIDTTNINLTISLGDNIKVSVAQEILIFVMIIALPAFIFKNMQSKYYNELSARNERFLEAELTASNIYREAQKDTRAFRHDINNNLTVISALMQEKKYSEAEKYINELRGIVSSLSQRISTGDEMLDSLVSSKLPDLDRKGIRITVSGVVDGGLGWKAIDICAVFANLIDNAAEACEQVENPDDRYITMSFRQTEFQRIITVANSVAMDVDCTTLEESVHYTSKPDKKNHGYGLKNIRRALDKYGAMMKLECSGDEFKTTIVTMK